MLSINRTGAEMPNPYIMHSIAKIGAAETSLHLERIEKIKQINIAAAEQLPDLKRKFINAALTKKIEEIASIDVQSELIKIILSAYTISGQKADDSTVAVNAIELHSRIMEVYPKATVEEIRTAIRAGIYDEYGEYFGLNVKSFMFFIRSYFTSQSRAAAIEEWNRKREVLNQEQQDPNVIRSDCARYINKLYRSYCSNNLDFDLIPAFVYDFIHRECSEIPPLDQGRAAVYYHTNIDQDKTRIVSKLINNAYSRDKAAGILHVAKQFAIQDYFKLCRSRKWPVIFFKTAFIS